MKPSVILRLNASYKSNVYVCSFVNPVNGNVEYDYSLNGNKAKVFSEQDAIAWVNNNQDVNNRFEIASVMILAKH